MKLQTVLFLFFSKFCASKLGVRLIYGCGLYTDVYGRYNYDRIIAGSLYNLFIFLSVENQERVNIELLEMKDILLL